MEQFIRENFVVVDWVNDDGSVEDAFEYATPDGHLRHTKINAFVENKEQFQDVIEYWVSQGMEVPQ